MDSLLGRRDDVIACDKGFMAVVAYLIHEWLLEADLAALRREDQVTAVCERDLLCSLEGELDLIRISAGGNDEVVFELSLVAVVDQVNAGVDVLVFDLLV